MTQSEIRAHSTTLPSSRLEATLALGLVEVVADNVEMSDFVQCDPRIRVVRVGVGKSQPLDQQFNAAIRAPPVDVDALDDVLVLGDGFGSQLLVREAADPKWCQSRYWCVTISTVGQVAQQVSRPHVLVDDEERPAPSERQLVRSRDAEENEVAGAEFPDVFRRFREKAVFGIGQLSLQCSHLAKERDRLGHEPLSKRGRVVVSGWRRR